MKFSQKFRLLIKNTFYLTFSQVLSKVLFLVLMILIARRLGTAGLGDYAFVFAFIMVAFPLTELGLTNLSIRMICRKKNLTGKLVANIWFMHGIAWLAISAAAAVFILLRVHSYTVRISLLLALIVIFCMTMIQSIHSVFRAYEKMQYQATVEIVACLVTVLLAAGFVLGGGGLISILLAYAVGNMVGLGLAVYLLYTRFPRPEFTIESSLCWYLLATGFYFWLGYVIALLGYNTDIFLLYSLKGNQVTGLYKAAYAVVRNLEYIPPLFLMALYPQLSILWQKSKEKLIMVYNRAILAMALTGVVLVGSVMLLARPLILLVYGKEFEAAIPALQILSLTTFFFLLNIVNTYYLFAVDRQKQAMFLAISGVLVNIVMDIALIPKYGLTGAVLGSVTGFAVGFTIKQLYIVSLNRKISRTASL